MVTSLPKFGNAVVTSLVNYQYPRLLVDRKIFEFSNFPLSNFLITHQ